MAVLAHPSTGYFKIKFSVKHCVHILDDFLFVGKPNTSECHDALAAFHILAADINLPIKAEKTVLPPTKITFLDLEIDSFDTLRTI